MTDLKTLKDMKFDMACHLDDKPPYTPKYFEEVVHTKDLRQEAIKWIKELSVLKYGRDPHNLIDKLGLGDVSEQTSGIINFIKYQYNLSEEDLK